MSLHSQIKFFLVLTSLVGTSVAASQTGPSGTGGTDPSALQAVNYGKAVVSWLQNHPHPGIDIDPSALFQEVNVISASLDGHDPLLVFHPTDTINCFGIPKKGCIDDSGIVKLAQGYWDKATNQERCTQAVVDFVRKQEIERVYEKVGEVCSSIAGYDLPKVDSAKNLQKWVGNYQRFTDLKYNVRCFDQIEIKYDQGKNILSWNFRGDSHYTAAAPLEFRNINEGIIPQRAWGYEVGHFQRGFTETTFDGTVLKLRTWDKPEPGYISLVSRYTGVDLYVGIPGDYESLACRYMKDFDR